VAIRRDAALPQDSESRIRRRKCVGIVVQQHISIGDTDWQGLEAAARAGSGNAPARTDLIERSVRAAHDQRIIGRQKAIGHPTERMTRMRTTIHVRKYVSGPTYDKTA
jgi:hypothetical protein